MSAQSIGLKLFPPPTKNKQGPSRTSPHQQSFIWPTHGQQSSMDEQATDGIDRHQAPERSEPAMSGRICATGCGAMSIPVSSTAPKPSPAQVVSQASSQQNALPALSRKDSGSSQRLYRTDSSPKKGEAIVNSIFPKYNPALSWEYQEYYPTQISSTHIPKTIISKRPYSPTPPDQRPMTPPYAKSLPTSLDSCSVRAPDIQSPASEISSVDELKELWKVTNGWRVSLSEGRSFCLELTKAAEEPIYTLSSSSQPFYVLRLDPTSTSAQMTLMRLDPNKPASKSGFSLSKLASLTKPDTIIEVMSTTLEEDVRRLPPNDGLEALLYPKAAANVAIDLASKGGRADDSAILAAAERECGRLVWDQDSQKHYLVHPALTTPFVVSIKSSPSWSRTEYILEHSELPHNLVRLVMEASGHGKLEIDSGAAARIDCFYVVDVAICAILLVAIGDEKNLNLKRFEVPPSLAPFSPKNLKEKKSPKPPEFEDDLESQDSVKDNKNGEKLSKSSSCVLSMIWGLCRCILWVLTLTAKALAAIIISISKCLTSKKL